MKVQSYESSSEIIRQEVQEFWTEPFEALCVQLALSNIKFHLFFNDSSHCSRWWLLIPLLKAGILFTFKLKKNTNPRACEEAAQPAVYMPIR